VTSPAGPESGNTTATGIAPSKERTMTTPRPAPFVTRRSLFATGGGLAAAGLIAACGSSSSSTPAGAGSSASSSASGGMASPAAFTGTLSFLLPGAVPTGWQTVLNLVNTKLKKDLGFTIAPEFISWANYATQSLLKFTAGDSFDTALEARWLNEVQLISSRSLVPLNSYTSGSAFPDLTKTVNSKLLKLNESGGVLYGIPQVNSAGRIYDFIVRQDLLDSYAGGEISDYGSLEKFLYDVKQKNSSMIPMGLNSGNIQVMTVTPGPVALFNEASWSDPSHIYQAFSGSSCPFYMSSDAAKTGSSKPVPFWELDGVMDALKTVRKYYLDGIINHDALNADAGAQQALFASGKYASQQGITDGTASGFLKSLQAAVKGSSIGVFIPLKDGTAAKPNQTFQADNNVVLNTRGQSHEAAMQLQNWVSIKENHDLLEYGVEGSDYKAVGSDQFNQLSQYSFPGYAISWRLPLELRSSTMSASEAKWFAWAQDYANFTVDPFASFYPDETSVKTQDAQVISAMTQYALPLFAGVVDPVSGLSSLQKALDRAGLDQLQSAMQTQADAYLKSQKSA
jgi:putative aldouronate transport system substrate-binding protein